MLNFKQALTATTLGALGAVGAFLSPVAHADGMVPETSVVLIPEADGEASINVKNTDAKTGLLYTYIEHIPDDKETLFAVTPPVARVDAGQTQKVRFLLTNKEPLKTERLARVIFDSIGERKDAKANTVSVRVRQNLPVVIRPKGLAVNREPWKLLKWGTVDGKFVVKNDSPYVVRLGTNVVIKPMDAEGQLPNAYVLPGQTVPVLLSEGLKALGDLKGREVTEEESRSLFTLPAGATGVDFQPATSYGYMAARHEAPIGLIERPADGGTPAASAAN